VRNFGVLLLYVVLSIVMTWPLARALDQAVAYPGDPYINTWILDWDWYATFHHASLFDANTFYPARDSLAFSENLYGIALLLFPFRALGVAPITAHNIAMLAGFTLCGFGMYLLALLATENPLASVVAGLFYAFVPFRFTHLSHVQYAWGGTLPLMLAALLWYERKPTWARAGLFAAAFLFNGLCNVHWLLFGSIAVAIAIVIVRPRPVPILACTAVAFALLAVFLHPYFEASRLYGMRRTWDETKFYSAMPADWLASNFHNRLYTFLRNPKVDPERWLFPGALSLVLGAIGVFSRRWKSRSLAASWIVLGFIGSLGLHTFFHRFLFSHVPGFAGIRVPARWASIAYVGLAMLVAFGAAMLARERRWVYVALAVAFLIELRSAPIRYFMSVPEPQPVYRWLAQVKPRALMQLPRTPESDYEVMLRATAHHRPIVNGISGFTPPQSNQIYDLADVWSDELVPQLRRAGVSHVLVRAGRLDATARGWLSRAIEHGDLAFARRFDDDWVFTIGGQPQKPDDLAALLAGKPTFSDATFGFLESPKLDEVLTPKSIASGFAFSAYGIREINLLMNDGGLRLPTRLQDDPALRKDFPWYDATTQPRFIAEFSNVKGILPLTDVQVEIVDGRGNRTLLEDRWVGWRGN